MKKRLIIAASIVALAAGASFGQKREACPNDTKEVNQRTSVEIGGLKYDRDTHECKDKGSSRDRSNDKDNGKDRDRDRDKGRDNDRGRDRGKDSKH